MKALIYEPLSCHHELIPSWAWALKRNDIANIDVYAPNAPRHRSILSVLETMGLQVNVVRSFKLENYTWVVNNSHYPSDHVFAIGQGIPPPPTLTQVLSVFHNVPKKDNGYTDHGILRSTRHLTLALGPHMHERFLGQHIRSRWAPPIFFGTTHLSIRSAEKHAQSLFVVQGGLENFRRNYGAPIRAINTIDLPFEVMFIGQGRQNFVDRHRAMVIDPERRSKLKILRNVPFQAYLEHITRASWVMPCIDNSFKHDYFTHKITSSVMVAIGNSTPLLLHSRLADIYGLTDGVDCIVYGDEPRAFLKAFERAATMPLETYETIRQGAILRYKEMLEQLEGAFSSLPK